VLACPLGCGEGMMVVAKTVVQHCRRVLGQSDRPTLTPGRGSQPPVDRRVQQRARIDMAEPWECRLGQASQLIVGRLPHGEDQGDRLGQQPPGCKR
jgi:hypothetical protein